MILAVPTIHRSDKGTYEAGPRRATSSEGFASYPDMTGLASLLPGAGMGTDCVDCSGSRSQASSSGDDAGIAEPLGPGTD